MATIVVSNVKTVDRAVVFEVEVLNSPEAADVDLFITTGRQSGGNERSIIVPVRTGSSRMVSVPFDGVSGPMTDYRIQVQQMGSSDPVSIWQGRLPVS